MVLKPRESTEMRLEFKITVRNEQIDHLKQNHGQCSLSVPRVAVSFPLPDDDDDDDNDDDDDECGR